MPLTTLDAKPALIVIDLQKGIVGMQTVHPASDIIARAAALAHAFRRRGFPVVLVNVAARPPGRTDAGMPAFAFPADFAELVPELDRQPGDHVVTKRSPGAFARTTLDEILQREGVTQVFMTGIATSIGVEATARAAFDLGYNVVFVTDAMTDRDAENHRHSIEKMFPRMGETATTEAVLAALA